jgi:hypothetical protein
MAIGRPAKPLEVKYRNGNPGRRPLPERSSLVQLPAADVPPEPLRPLGTVGAAMWVRVWTAGAVWLATKVDIEAVQMLCEQMDERQALRSQVLKYGDWRDRAGLRHLDRQVLHGLGAIGFTPTERTRMGVAEVRSVSRIEQLRLDRDREDRKQRERDVNQAPDGIIDVIAYEEVTDGEAAD